MAPLLTRESAPVVPQRIGRRLAAPLLFALGALAACDTRRSSLDGAGGGKSFPTEPTPGASGATSGHTTSVGATTVGSSVSTSSGHASAETGATSSSSGAWDKTCEQVTTRCFGDGANPLSGCVECAALGTADEAMDAGGCHAEYNACFGDGSASCAGGQPGCCTYSNCRAACDVNHNGTIDAAELKCVCTVNSNGLGCAPDQYDTNTCLGALTANSPAYHAMQALDQCVAAVCSHICYGQ